MERLYCLLSVAPLSIIDAIEFRLLLSIYFVFFCSSVSLITFLLTCHASFFLSFALQLLSLVILPDDTLLIHVSVSVSVSD